MRALWPVFLIACNSSAAPQPAGAGSAKLDTSLGGRELYAGLCAACHGKTLEGYIADHAPALGASTFLESATDDYLKQSIATGRPGTSMGAYGKQFGGPLDDAAIARVVKFIRDRGNVPAKPLKQLSVKGDATVGAKLYETQCRACHGDQSTRGEAVMLANGAFLMQATDAYIRHAIVNGRPNTKMVPFKFTEQNIADVIAYIRTLGGPVTQAAPEMKQLPAPTGKEPLVIFPKGKEPDWKLKDDRFVSDDIVKKAYDEKRKFVIIDARPPSEWMRVHITGAVSIPYFDTTRLDDIPKDVWVIAYCACPHHLSGEVVDALRKKGHVKSAILDEGINDWHRKGYPVTAAEGVMPPPADPGVPAGAIR